MRFPQLFYFTFLTEIEFSVGTEGISSGETVQYVWKAIRYPQRGLRYASLVKFRSTVIPHSASSHSGM